MKERYTISKVFLFLALQTLLVNVVPNITVAQTYNTLQLKILDTDGSENGLYYNYIDSVSVFSDTTVNFHLIPNIEIQDSTLKKRYGNDFLEMVKWNLGKEPELFDQLRIAGVKSTRLNRYEFPIKYYPGNYSDHLFGHFTYDGNLHDELPWHLSSVDFDDVLRELFNELNTKIGNLFLEVQSNPDWTFTYEGRDINTSTSLDSLNNPVSSNINFRNYVLDFPNAFDELSIVIVAQILLNNDFDKDLLLLGDNDLYDYFSFPKERFSPDLINIIKLIRGLENGFDFSKCVHRKPRLPIPKIDVIGSLLVNHEILLNGNLSTVPDSSSIVTYNWSQEFMDNLDLEYISSNLLTISDSTGESISVSTEWPGKYRVKLKVTTDSGRSFSAHTEFEILMEKPRDIGMGVMMADIWAPEGLYNIETFSQTLEALKENGGNYFVYVDMVYITQAYPVPKIENIYPSQKQMTIEKEDFLYIMSEVTNKGLTTIYRHTSPGLTGEIYQEVHQPHSIDYWQVFFDELKANYLEKAAMCEEANVDKMILDQINLQGFPYAGNWSEKDYHEQRWRDIISSVKSIFSGDVGIQQAIGGNWDMQPSPISYLKVIPWLDAVDFVTVFFVSPLTDENDITVEAIRFRANRAVSSILDNFYDQFNKPVIFQNWIEHIDGAAKYPPHQFDGFPPGTEVSYKDAVDLFDGIMQTIIYKPYIVAVVDIGYSWLDRFDEYYSRRAIGMRAHPEEELYKLWLKIVK